MRTSGGIYIAKDGRARVYLRNGSRAHYARCVMEAHLGRDLQPHEDVHHVNGDRTDDRVENLQVLTASEHSRLHLSQRTEARRDRAPLTREQVAEIKASTERTSVLARRYGVTEGAITYHRGRFHDPALDEAVIARIRLVRAEGHTITETAAIVGCGTSSVEKYAPTRLLKAHGRIG